MRVRTWDSLHQDKFCKNSLKGVYPFWANLYQKIPIFGDLGGCRPTFLNPVVKFGMRVQTRGSLPQAKLQFTVTFNPITTGMPPVCMSQISMCDVHAAENVTVDQASHRPSMTESVVYEQPMAGK